MSDGADVMRGGSDAPALWAPPWDGVEKMGARFVLAMMCRWADGRGCVPGTAEEMAARLGIGYSTFRDYLAILQREKLISKPAQARLQDGTMSPLRHWLNLAKVGNPEHHRQNSAPVAGAENLSVAEGRSQNSAPVGEAVAGVDKAVDGPEPELSAGGLTGAETQQTGAEFQQPEPELSAGENGGVITTGARGGASARAEFPFPASSYFLSFAWRDEATKVKAARILAACGPQLGKLGDQHNRVLMSLAYVLDGLCDDFDFERDVLPVIPRKTGPGRKTPLWDFALITENIEAYRAKRLRDEARVADRVGKGQPAEGAERKAASKGSGGRGGNSDLDRALARYRAEEAYRNGGAADGGGDGQG